ncbi:hypothetical protein OROMI_003451 [Orobanche minor]
MRYFFISIYQSLDDKLVVVILVASYALSVGSTPPANESRGDSPLFYVSEAMEEWAKEEEHLLENLHWFFECSGVVAGQLSSTREEAAAIENELNVTRKEVDKVKNALESLSYDENIMDSLQRVQVLRTNQFGSIFGISRFTFHLSEELVKFIMDPKSDVHVNGNDKSGGLSEVRNSNVSGRIEAFNCLAEGNNFPDVLQSKRGHCGDVPASKITKLMKLGNLESASTHSLFSEDNNDL